MISEDCLLENTTSTLVATFNQMKEDALKEYLLWAYGIFPKEPLSTDTIKHLQENYSVHHYLSDNSTQFVRESDQKVLFKVGIECGRECGIKVYLEEYWRRNNAI